MNFKPGISGRIKPGRLATLDGTARGFFRFEPQEKLFQFGAFAFDLDADAVSRVVDKTGQPQFVRQAIDEWAEADALHHAADRETQAGGGSVQIGVDRQHRCTLIGI
jgi:hypothetical protein